MHTIQRVLAGLAAAFLATSCGAPPAAPGGPAAPAERTAARYRVLTAPATCVCTAAFGTATAQNSAAVDTFEFDVVDEGATGDLANVAVWIGASLYTAQAADVAIAGSLVTVTANPGLFGNPTLTIAVVITFDMGSGAFTMSVGGVQAIAGTATNPSPPAPQNFGLIPNSCELSGRFVRRDPT